MRGESFIVTGATGGLGKTLTRMLLEDGTDVMALYRDDAKYAALKATSEGRPGRLMGFRGDASNEEDAKGLVAAAVAAYGKVDALLNIVGGYTGGSLVSETPVEVLDAMFSLNVRSAFLCSKAVLPHMMERNRGRIVNVSARTAVVPGRMGKSSAYSIAKAGVKVLTEALADEVAKYNINVNCVMPSTIDTEENRANNPKADYSRWVPGEQVAEAILFLASDRAKPISGAALPVYGRA